jgi:hypothetical protein
MEHTDEPIVFDPFGFEGIGILRFLGGLRTIIGLQSAGGVIVDSTFSAPELGLLGQLLRHRADPQLLGLPHKQFFCCC